MHGKNFLTDCMVAVVLPANEFAAIVRDLESTIAARCEYRRMHLEDFEQGRCWCSCIALRRESNWMGDSSATIMERRNLMTQKPPHGGQHNNECYHGFENDVSGMVD